MQYDEMIESSIWERFAKLFYYKSIQVHSYGWVQMFASPMISGWKHVPPFYSLSARKKIQHIKM